ncbi:hypothetical protein [Paenibacillus arenosi]|uniref:Uncharacterized protein n=1 Tax=Paenibacillus arenosi TaxID=2774142 RepID=A0ABR9B4E7_9BACL|nr:hypothetical protein [Paenibacillus arenosi]MBD8500061.1 hypothetical protein [Paenibacillus arenosi]
MNLVSEFMLILYGVSICIISFLLLLLVKKMNHIKKMMFINEVVRANVNVDALLFSRYYFVFIEPGSEQHLSNLIAELPALERNTNVLIVYAAAEWRANMLRKKLNDSYCFYIDESKKLVSLLQIEAYPCVVSVHYPSSSIKKII